MSQSPAASHDTGEASSSPSPQPQAVAGASHHQADAALASAAAKPQQSPELAPSSSAPGASKGPDAAKVMSDAAKAYV